MNKSTIIGLLTSAIALVLGLSAPAAAHVQTSSGGVSAVMHILPDDNPVAGKPTYIKFTFGGSASTTIVEDCACTLTVADSTRRVVTVPVEPIENEAGNIGRAEVTFSESGAYTLSINGQENLRLNYTVKVASATSNINREAGTEVLLISATSFILLIMVARQNIKNGLRYTKQQPPKRRKT